MIFPSVYPRNPFAQPFQISHGTNPTYAQLVLSIPNLVQYLKLDETSGTTAADSSGNSCTGTYKTGVTLNDTAGPGATMGNAPKFDGTAGYVDAFTAALAALVNAAAGSFGIWCKVLNSGVWSDGAVRYPVAFGRDVNNEIEIHKRTAANATIAQYLGSGTSANAANSSFSPTTWFHVALTWVTASNRARYYVNGAQVGSDFTTAAFSSNTLTAATLGALFLVSGFWSGWLSNHAAFSRELTASEILTLATAI